MRNPFFFLPQWSELYEERAAIMQNLGGMSREAAELAAERDINAQIERERAAGRLQKELFT